MEASSPMKIVFPTLIPTHPHFPDRSFATGSIPFPPFASRLVENTLRATPRLRRGSVSQARPRHPKRPSRRVVHLSVDRLPLPPGDALAAAARTSEILIKSSPVEGREAFYGTGLKARLPQLGTSCTLEMSF